MIRALLITTVVSLLVAIVSFAGSAQLGGAGDWPKKVNWTWTSTTTTEHNDGEPFTGDPGQRTSRDFAWSGGDSLDVNVPGEVIYTQGPNTKVTITAPEAVLDRIRLEDDEISRTGSRIDMENSKILIVVQAPAVNEFSFNGGQKVTIRNYAQDSLEIESNGAAEIVAEGTARTVDLRINGAGSADLGKLANDEAKVELNGAAHASLAPKSAVDIRINGVGNVSLATRPPRVSTEIHGLGSVTYGSPTEGAAPPAPVPPKTPAPPRLPATST